MRKLLIIFLFSFAAFANAGLKELYERFTNYKTDYNVDEIIRLFLKGAPLTVDYLLNKEDDTPIEEDVTFWCINRDTKVLQQTFLSDSPEDLRKKIDVTKPIAFLTHGWIDNVNRTWVQETVKDYIKFVDTNVCAVDWNRLANYEYAISAMRNVFMVADHMVDFINMLKRDHQMGYDRITLVGHSLGGQISGLVGGKLNGEVPEIYALDPAGPFFTHPTVRSLEHRLDPSDAKYVQVIYTTRFMLGCGIEVGHQNFKPNIGICPQPGCIFAQLTNGTSPEILSCSHSHATVLFRYSLNPENVFTARKCKSALAFLTMCTGTDYDRMGIHAKKEVHGDFYLLTSSTAPYV